MRTTLVWFGNDLRLADNPALYNAAQSGVVVPVFIWAPDEENPWPPGGAKRWWLMKSLHALSNSLDDMESKLIVRVGPSLDVILELVNALDAQTVFWNQRLLPHLRSRDVLVRKALESKGIDVKTFSGRILHDPELVKTGTGSPYRVYSAFRKKLGGALDVGRPLPAPQVLRSPDIWPITESIDDLPLSPIRLDGVDWAKQMDSFWHPGEQGAHQQLNLFLDSGLHHYDERRDRPDLDGSSMLSPYLNTGELSPRQVWYETTSHEYRGLNSEAKEVFLSEIAWREFAYHLLWHFPQLPDTPLRENFFAMPWRNDPDATRAWQNGQTGYPIVDAGIRQLWSLGWMHNRARMITASFLTKHLLVSWQKGEAWFWDTLVDSDLACNAMNWQWVAGSGADAQPFFRIFNPISQGKRFDPDGKYVRHWVPELKNVPNKYIHNPWDAPSDVLKKAGVILGSTYPFPIVDHQTARKRALAAWSRIK